jgi:ribosomal protein S18 acetylase RimI-like enzyme
MTARQGNGSSSESGLGRVDIRRLGPADHAAYRDLMLEAYARHPEAFTSSFEERARAPASFWEDRLRPGSAAPTVVLGAFANGSLVGTVAVAFESRERLRHKATLTAMYVQSRCRSRGLGEKLVKAALHNASGRDIRVIQLTVSEGNSSAVRLYERCGFKAFAIEPMAVMGPGGPIAKVHMWLVLEASTARTTP